MRVNKVLGAYLIDKGQEISESKEPLCPLFISELMQIFAKAESKNNKEDKPEPEECLTCELLNMLGLPSEVLDSIGEHTSSTNPLVKIKIKKVSSASDLDKLLKELKSGGTIDLNTANDKLGEIFDLNSIQLIMETPMFKLGGLFYDGLDNKVNPKILELKTLLNLKKYPNITEDQAAGRAPIIENGKKYFLNGDGELIPAKEDGGIIVNNEITLEEFLNS